jgi:hypothetical protein
MMDGWLRNRIAVLGVVGRSTRTQACGHRPRPENCARSALRVMVRVGRSTQSTTGGSAAGSCDRVGRDGCSPVGTSSAQISRSAPLPSWRSRTSARRSTDAADGKCRVDRDHSELGRGLSSAKRRSAPLRNALRVQPWVGTVTYTLNMSSPTDSPPVRLRRIASRLTTSHAAGSTSTRTHGRDVVGT